MNKNLLPNGITIGKAQVIVDIVKKGNEEIRPAVIITPKFMTYHNTGNSSKGANAKAHNTYIHNLASYHPKDTSHISWHLTVDENFIYQHIPFNEMAYHCGDGVGVNSGNKTSIGIEIAEHVDQKNYHQAEENAIALGLYIAKMWNIPIENHVPHKKWSGKNCPRVILGRDGGFTKFHNRIKDADKGVKITMDEVQKLQSQIDELKTMMGNKADIKSEEEVSDWAKSAWDWAKSTGITDGKNPHGTTDREQLFTVLSRYENLPKTLLNSTGRDSAVGLINKGVKEGLFFDKHENVDNYNDIELLSYALAYIDRKFNN